MDTETPGITLPRILFIIFCVLIVFGGYETISALAVWARTGTLVVTTSASNSRISISQDNHDAAIIGTGSARVRLTPGLYDIVALSDGQQTSAVVTVTKGQTAQASLKVNESTALRTVASINFQGMDALISSGLTIDQVNELEQYFFQYNSSANTVSVDPNSVEPGPHDPNVDTSFTTNFNVTVDTTAYKAVISYADLNNVSLNLYNAQTNAPVFSSAATPQGTNGN